MGDKPEQRRGPGRPRRTVTQPARFADGATEEDLDEEFEEEAKEVVKGLLDNKSQVGIGVSGSQEQRSVTPLAEEGMEDRILARLQELLPSILADLGSLKPASSDFASKVAETAPQARERAAGGIVSALEKKVAPQIQSKRVMVKRSVPRVDDEDDLAAQGDVEDSYVRVLLERAKKVGSVALWCNQLQWKQARNRRECQTLAEAFDAFVEEGLGEDSMGLEILARRLAGVQLADKTNDWSFCDAIQGPGLMDSVLPRKMFSKALRDAASLRRLSDRTRPKFRTASRVSVDRSQLQESRRSHGRGGVRAQ